MALNFGAIFERNKMFKLFWSKRRLKFLRKEKKETQDLIELQGQLNELLKEENKITKEKK